jgi:hypothetical protein
MLHHHAMWLNPSTMDVRTMQGWKDWYRENAWPQRTRLEQSRGFSATFERFFNRASIQHVTVILEHR